MRERAAGFGIRIHAVRADAIGGAGEPEWVIGGAVLRRIDGGEELHAITHWDGVFELGVILFEPGLIGWLQLVGAGLSRRERAGKYQHRPASQGEAAQDTLP